MTRVRLPAYVTATVCVALLLAALSYVTWRQTRAHRALAQLEDLRRELSLSTATRNELGNRIQVLESRGRIVEEARERLEMRTPNGSEIVWLGDAATSENDTRAGAR